VDAPDYHHRLVLTLPASAGGGDLKVGVIFTGKDFFRWTGLARPSVKTMMLGTAQGRILLQVDERDGTGKIVAEPNGKLDDDDQVSFLADLGATPRKLYLYYDGRTRRSCPRPRRSRSRPGTRSGSPAAT